MNIRESWEDFEGSILSKYAMLSRNTQGRDRKETPCEVRTEFQRDRDRILHSKSFRRLKHKTQVFVSPGDHFRTRLTHTLEVSQIARTIARGLRLNEDLTEAISLGHDLGHAPFGHGGEDVLADILKNKDVKFSFNHNIQSLRVVEFLEKEGRGLNLTKEVRDGIKCHTGKEKPQTLEGQIVRIADRIAYLNHDLEDSFMAGILVPEDLPREISQAFGNSSSQRINTMVKDMILNSWNQNEIKMSEEAMENMNLFREFMFRNVYLNETAKGEDIKAERLLRELYAYYEQHTEEIPGEYKIRLEDSKERRIIDYLSGMTDSYAVEVFEKIFVPQGYHPIERKL